MLSRTWKIIIVVTFSVVVVILAFFMFEGLASTIFVAHKIMASRPAAERLHTKYDEELGWINIPNLHIEDMYGSGKYLKTNSQMFRNNKDFEANIKDHRLRIVCSGDSFTFGYGVDNDHTWCHILTLIDPKLETVNMGQGGYGIDQSYLWYKRKHTLIDHDIHVFAFITVNFKRMESNTLSGYGKPVLELRDGILHAKNIPVPKRGFYVPWLTHVVNGIGDLSSVKLLAKLRQAIFTASETEVSTDQINDIVIKVFEELYRINRRKNSILVLVYLPTMDDYTGNGSDIWRRFIDTHVANDKIVYIDLIENFKKVPPQDIKKMFIAPGVLDYYYAAGHYTEEGNAYIAEMLYNKLIGIPEISKKLVRAERVKLAWQPATISGKQ
jgi:hypothetical protein